ncbi:hypothetical protein ACFVIY_18880 [Streptomyces sp. NPDC127166]|uniref:hypothetical protein n=1 Tax=Streptomyces sp. NPDC127166 TaxID=3345380 RepID=UPI003639B13E
MTEEITPEDLITPNHEFMMHNIRHGSLAPKVAEERWQALQAVTAEIERLSDLYYDKVASANAAEKEAVKLNAEAAATGKAVPSGTAVKALEAKLAVNGCGEALKAQLSKLSVVRNAYDALWDDLAFVAKYRAAISSEFLKRRTVALKAFRELEAQVPALAELYQTLGEFTLDHLLKDSVHAIEFDGNPLPNGGVFTGQGHGGWDAAKLREAIGTARRYVLNDDPIMGGTLLTEDLNTISAALPELAEQRYEEWQEELAASRMQMRNSGPYGGFSH